MKKKVLIYFCTVLILTLFNCSPNGTAVPECSLSSCENNGVLEDCACICEDGYSGPNCERLDPAFAQKLLNDGFTPFELLNANIPLDSVYGREYQGGIIFHLNATNKLIKVAVTKDLEEDLRWPNAMDYSENLIVQSFDDWYLPSIDELQEMRIILYTRLEKGEFNDDYYWSSETVENSPTDAYGVFFPNGNVGPIEKDRQNHVSLNFVRPVRQIQL